MRLNRVSHFLTLSVALLGLLSACAGPDVDKSDTAYTDLKAYIDSIRVIDCHEHQRMEPILGRGEINFYTILGATYLPADLISAGAPPLVDRALIDSGALDSLWTLYGPYLDRCRNTSYYGQFVEGFRLLYGMRERYFTRENIAELSRQIGQNYADPRRWHGEAFAKAPFELMLDDQWWDQAKTELEFDYYALVMRLDQYFVSIAEGERLRVDTVSLSNPFNQARQQGLELNSLDDYLAFAAAEFQKFAQAGAVCAKSANTYHRSIDYGRVSREDAERLFARPSGSLSPQEKKTLQDFMFRWCVAMCDSLDLPLQIHTGYKAGNRAALEDGHPMKLLDIFQSYPEQQFSLFHGGYPWFQDIAAIGKSYPNVCLDLVWLPQIARESAESALGQWLDAVPYSKLFWGGDCTTIEEAVGSLEYGRQVVARVLADKVDRGYMDMALAREIARGIFRDNAIRFFRLEQKLGRSFS